MSLHPFSAFFQKLRIFGEFFLIDNFLPFITPKTELHSLYRMGWGKLSSNHILGADFGKIRNGVDFLFISLACNVNLLMVIPLQPKGKTVVSILVLRASPSSYLLALLAPATGTAAGNVNGSYKF